MKIKISNHALQRGLERGITEEGICNILSGNIFVVTAQSSIDPEAVWFYGEFENKVWAVLLNISTKIAITVRRARKNEVKPYEQEKRNWIDRMV